MLRILYYWPLCVCTLSIISTVLSFPIEIDVESKKEFPSEKLNVITRQDKLAYEIGKKNLERKDALDDFLQAVRPRLFMLPAQDGHGVSVSNGQFLVIPVVVPYEGSASPGSKIPFAEGQLSIPEILKTNPFLAQMDSRHVAINILPISPNTPPVTAEKVESTEGESESEESESTTFNTPVMQIQTSSNSTRIEIAAVTKKAFVSDVKTTPEASTLKSVAGVTKNATEKASSTSSTTVTENASLMSSSTVTTTTSTTTASSPVIPVTVTITSSTAESAANPDYNYEYGDYSKADKKVEVETATEKQLDEDYNDDD